LLHRPGLHITLPCPKVIVVAAMAGSHEAKYGFLSMHLISAWIGGVSNRQTIDQDLSEVALRQVLAIAHPKGTLEIPSFASSSVSL
jgi:hypothetical protein